MERELYRSCEAEANHATTTGIVNERSAYFDSGWDLFENSAVISCSRLRNDSPTLEKTSAHALRSFSSALADSPETTSRDWWSSLATVVNSQVFETLSRRVLNSPVAVLLRSAMDTRNSSCCFSVMAFHDSHSGKKPSLIFSCASRTPFSSAVAMPAWKRFKKLSCSSVKRCAIVSREAANCRFDSAAV